MPRALRVLLAVSFAAGAVGVAASLAPLVAARPGWQALAAGILLLAGSGVILRLTAFPRIVAASLGLTVALQAAATVSASAKAMLSTAIFVAVGIVILGLAALVLLTLVIRLAQLWTPGVDTPPSARPAVPVYLRAYSMGDSGGFFGITTDVGDLEAIQARAAETNLAEMGVLQTAIPWPQSEGPFTAVALGEIQLLLEDQSALPLLQ